ncbi:unnamed protein product [Arabidopsis halleri]
MIEANLSANKVDVDFIKGTVDYLKEDVDGIKTA